MSGAGAVYDLPTAVTVGGREYAIRWDYRAILDICIALSDPELTERERAWVALTVFYPGLDTMPPEDYTEALDRCFRFIDRDAPGEGESGGGKKSPRLMDWEQDFPLIVAPINRVLGREIRSMEALHWWTFLAAYMEIGGDCTFAQVVSIRDKLQRHKKLDKAEREWLKRNRPMVELKTRYTAAEDELVKAWSNPTVKA